VSVSLNRIVLREESDGTSITKVAPPMDGQSNRRAYLAVRKERAFLQWWPISKGLDDAPQKRTESNFQQRIADALRDRVTNTIRQVEFTPMAQMVILLAEDEEIVRTLATTSLQKENFLVLPACNGEDALRVSKSHSKVDLLVADVHMGDGINGIELAKRITEERPGIRVLVMSGYFDSEASIRGTASAILEQTIHAHQFGGASPGSAGV
jgi:CheY-like chemotaxis protein